MDTVRKTIILTEAQDRWIRDQIEAGNYSDDSECIRELITHEQERNADIEAVRAALIEGERTGEPDGPLDSSAFKQRMLAKYG